MSDELPVVSILIVNFESTGFLRGCLDAIAASSAFRRTETVVVDNGSREFDPVAMGEAYPWVRFLPQATNLTFTRATNLAAQAAAGRHLLLLNPDTRVEPLALERALVHLEEEPQLSAVGAHLVDDSGRLQRYYRRVPSALDIPIMLMPPLFKSTSRGRHYLMTSETFGERTSVEQPPGAFLLIRGRASPLLDPAYFNYVSDVELCARLQRRGPIAVFADVRCWHLGGGAGVGTTDRGEQLRLHHDLTWGSRRFFHDSGWAARRYLDVWLVVFWFLRITQVAPHPLLVGLAVRTAWRALRGEPPRYG